MSERTHKHTEKKQKQLAGLVKTDTHAHSTGSSVTFTVHCESRYKHTQLGLSHVGKRVCLCTTAVFTVVIFTDQDTEKRTASIKSILSGSPRERLVACGVLATSSYYCSVSKTAARSLLLQPAISFHSLHL